MHSFYDVTVQGVTLRRCTLLDEAGVKHAFGTKLGGFGEGECLGLNFNRKSDIPVGSVDKNIALLASCVGFEREKLARTMQVHEDTVLYAHADYTESIEGCDGLFTDCEGKALMVLGADCIPVLLYDTVKNVSAAVHSGWRGTALSIAGKAVSLMGERFGCFPGNILCAIGPGICEKCFETHDDVPRAMEKLIPFAHEHMVQKPSGKWNVDLKGIIRQTLLKAGLEDDRICVDSDCTCCLGEKYWSHRRIGPRRGTQGAVIVNKE